MAGLSSRSRAVSSLARPAGGSSVKTVAGRVAFLVVSAVTCAAIGWLLYLGPLHPPPADGSRGYRLVWQDNFNGPAGSRPSPAHWRIVTGGGGYGNQELQAYTSSPRNLRLDGKGKLLITARRQRYTDSRGITEAYTSAQIDTLHRFQTRYGRIEARIRLPAGQGLWPAFWAMGADFARVGWPAAGEIDVVENAGDPFEFISVLHGPWRGHPAGYNLIASKPSSASLAAGYHVFGIDWSPGEIVYTLDGVAYLTRTRSSLPAGGVWVFDRPFYFILNLAVGGRHIGAPAASTRFPATMRVDWVRAYAIGKRVSH